VVFFSCSNCVVFFNCSNSVVFFNCSNSVVFFSCSNSVVSICRNSSKNKKNKKYNTVETAYSSEHLSSLIPFSDFSGIHVTRSLVVCVCFVDRCLSFCPFSFSHCCWLFFFDLRILITLLVSSKSSKCF
jgi:hypothetical protein